MSYFDERLNELLVIKSITPEQLAVQIGVSLPTVYEWKNGNKIFYSNLLKLCEVLNCSIEFLVGRTDVELDFTPQTPPPFPLALRRMMKQRGVSTYLLRKQTRFDGSYFARWDKGAEPYLSTLIELANYFSCTVDQLVGRERS